MEKIEFDSASEEKILDEMAGNVNRKRYSAVLTFNLKSNLHISKKPVRKSKKNVLNFESKRPTEYEDVKYEEIEIDNKKLKIFQGLGRVIAPQSGVEKLKMISRGNINFANFSTLKDWLYSEYQNEESIEYDKLFHFDGVEIERLFFCSTVQEIYTYLFLFNWDYFDINKVSREKRFLPLRKQLLKNISALVGKNVRVEKFGKELEAKLDEKNKAGETRRILMVHQFFYDFHIPEDFFIEKVGYGCTDEEVVVLKIQLKISTKTNLVRVVKSLKSTFNEIFDLKCFMSRDYIYEVENLKDDKEQKDEKDLKEVS